MNDEEDALIFEDYSRIIEELQSHRREIEKLQSDFAANSGGQQQMGTSKDDDDEDVEAKGGGRERVWH